MPALDCGARARLPLFGAGTLWMQSGIDRVALFLHIREDLSGSKRGRFRSVKAGGEMSTSTGNFVYSANRPDLADGDENDFNVSVSGPINLNFNVDSAGNLSGTASLTSSVQGSTPDDQDGDDDSFSDSGSGTGTLTGSLSSGVQASGSLSNGGAFSFQGTFANQATTINGVITLTDPNLPGSVNANVSLSSSLTPFPSTPMPVNIDAGGFAFDQAYDGLVDKSAVNAAQIFLKRSKGIVCWGTS